MKEKTNGQNNPWRCFRVSSNERETGEDFFAANKTTGHPARPGIGLLTGGGLSGFRNRRETGGCLWIHIQRQPGRGCLQWNRNPWIRWPGCPGIKAGHGGQGSSLQGLFGYWCVWYWGRLSWPGWGYQGRSCNCTYIWGYQSGGYQSTRMLLHRRNPQKDASDPCLSRWSAWNRHHLIRWIDECLGDYRERDQWNQSGDIWGGGIRDFLCWNGSPVGGQKGKYHHGGQPGCAVQRSGSRDEQIQGTLCKWHRCSNTWGCGERSGCILRAFGCRCSHSWDGQDDGTGSGNFCHGKSWSGN